MPSVPVEGRGEVQEAGIMLVQFPPPHMVCSGKSSAGKASRRFAVTLRPWYPSPPRRVLTGLGVEAVGAVDGRAVPLHGGRDMLFR